MSGYAPHKQQQLASFAYLCMAVRAFARAFVTTETKTVRIIVNIMEIMNLYQFNLKEEHFASIKVN